jgi:hypothetical protein
MLSSCSRLSVCCSATEADITAAEFDGSDPCESRDDRGCETVVGRVDPLCDDCVRSEREEERGDTEGSEFMINDAWLPPVCVGVIAMETGRAEGGGASKGMTGEGGEGDGARSAGEGDSVVVPLNPAKMAGMGEAIASWKEGGGAKYVSSTSAAPARGFNGGVGGGLSAYEAESESPFVASDRRKNHDIDGPDASVPRSVLVGSFDEEVGRE